MAKNKQANGQNRDIDTILGRKKNKSDKTVANLPQTARGEERLLQLFREKEKKKGEEGLLQLFREKEKKKTQQTNGTLTGRKPQKIDTAKNVIAEPQQVTDSETARRASWDLFDSSKRWAISDAYTGKNRQQAEVTQGPEMPASEPAQPKTAEDISKESYQTILGNIGADVTGKTQKPTAADARTNIAQPGKTTGGNMAGDILKGSAKQAGTQTGAQMPEKGAQASNNVSQDSYNKILSNITGKPADAKSQPAGGEVTMPEAQQPVQQPQAPVQQPAQVQQPVTRPQAQMSYSERLKQVLGEDARKEDFGAAQKAGESLLDTLKKVTKQGQYIPTDDKRLRQIKAGTGTSKRQEFYNMMNGIRQKQYEENNLKNKQDVAQYENWLWHTNSAELASKQDRDYKRQAVLREKQSTEDQIAAIGTESLGISNRITGYQDYMKTPQGIVRMYYDRGDLEGINATIRRYPEVFEKYDLPEYVDWMALNPLGGNLIDIIAPSVGSLDGEKRKDELKSRLKYYDQMLAELDEADAKWEPINKYETEMAGKDAAYRPEEVIQSAKGYDPNLAGNTDLRSYEGEYGVNEITNELEQAYEVAALRDKYKAEGRYDIPAIYMDDTQASTFMALMNEGRIEEAQAYYDAIKQSLNDQWTKHYIERAKALAESGSGSEYTTGIASIGFSFLGGFMGAEGLIRSLAGDKEAQDPNSRFYLATNISKAIREQSGENTGRKLEKVFGKPGYEAGKYLNSVKWSIYDNLFAVAAGGGVIGGAETASEALTLLTLSTQAGSNQFIENRNNNMDPVMASLMAIGSMLIEAGSEKMGFDAIFKPKASEFMGSAMQFAKFMAKSGAAEAGEEGVSSVANMIMDQAAATFTDHETDIERSAQEYIDRKKAESNYQYTSADVRRWRAEGRQEAWGGFWKETAMDMLSGFLSSVPMAGGRGIANIGSMNAVGADIMNSGPQTAQDSGSIFRKTTSSENVDYLINIGKSMNTDTNSYQFADKLAKRKASGKKISNFDLGRLATNLEYETSEQMGQDAKDAVVSVITGQLREQGVESGKAQALAGLVYKAKTQGINALNKREVKELSDNVPASQIYMEMTEKGDQDVTAAVSEAAQKAAKAAKTAAFSATEESREKLDAARSIISGKGGYTINEKLIGEDTLKEARKSVGTASEETINMMGGREAIGTAASTVITYTSDQKNGTDAKAGKVVGFKDGKLQVQYADGTQADVNPANVETTDGNAQGIIGYMRTNKGFMSDDVATKAMVSLDALGEEAAPKFAEDIIKINMAARLGREMPTKGISIREDIAKEIYNTAHDEYEKAQQERIEEGGELTPGKGKLHDGEVRYGTKEWTEKYKNLSKEQKDQLYIANRFAEVFGFDIKAFSADVLTDKKGRRTQQQGWQSGSGIGLNINGKILMMDGPDIARNMLNALGHEAPHWLQKHSIEGYNELRNYALNELEKSGNYNLEQEIKKKIDLYNRFYQQTNEIDPKTKQIRQATIDDAIYEIVSDACDQMFSSKEFEQRLLAEAPKAHSAIKEFVRNMVARLKNALKGISASGSKESETIRMFGGIKAIDELARIWLGGYDNVIHKAVLQQETGIPEPATHAETVGGKTYSAEQINDSTKMLEDAKSEPKEHFSLTAPVEMRKDGMIAVHNLDERSILSDLAMKGFPMPSIAVLSDKVAWEDYGDISIFFGEDAVDFADGTVYSGDAYTPVMGKYQAKSAEDALEYLRTQKARNPHMAYSTMDLFNNYLRIQNIDQAREKTNAYWNMDKMERIANKRRLKAIENDIMDQVAGFMDQEENTNRYTRKEDRFNFDVGYGMLLAAEELNKRENLSQNEKYEILQESLEKAAEENGSKVYDYGKDGTKIYDDMLEFIDGASRLASTFVESKPNRILGFGDVKAVVVPDSVQESTIQALKDAGVRDIITYDPGVENARVEALKSVPENVPNVSFSIQQMDDGTKFVDVDTDQDQFKGLKPKEILRMASKIIRNKFVNPERSKNLYEFTDGDKAYIDAKTADEYAYTSKTKLKEAAKRAKGKAAPELDNLIKIATEIKPGDDDYPNPSNHPYKGNTIGFKYYKTLFRVGGRFFTGIINVEDKGTHKRIKDVTQIKISESRSWPNDNTSRQADNKSVVAANAYDKNITQGEKNFKQEVEDALAHPKKDFSLTTPVEATKDLVAVHNLNAEQLMKTLQLGGFPMPSIAIVKSDYAHNRYGDVSVIFYRDTIDPKKSSANKVYGGDAWTPTYPTTEYKVSRKALEKLQKKITSLVPENIRSGLSFSSLDETNITKAINSYRGDFVKALKDNMKLRAAFLEDTGHKIKYPMRTKQLTNGYSNDQIMAVMNVLDEDTIREAYMSSSSYIDEHPEIGEKIRKVIDEQWKKELAEKGVDKEHILKAARISPYSEDNWGFSKTYKAIEGAYLYLKRGLQEEVDENALKEQFKKDIDEEAYEQWIREQFGDIIEKSGLRNNKDYYTDNGNIRSWESLHDEETLDNIVRIMKQQGQKGGNAFFSQSEMLALGTRDFKSVKDIQEHKGQLKHISDEEMSAAKKKIVEGFGELMDEMSDKRERNVFIARDRALQAMVEAVKKSKTADGIMRELRQWHGLNLTEDVGDRIEELLKEIADLPTEYFEAKPMRAVGLDEIANVVLPEGTDPNLISQLEAQGIPYTTYDGTDEGRRTAVNETPNVHFSLTTQHPDNMDVRVWMDSVPESSLATEAEKELLRSYKGLRLAIDLDREKQRGYKKRIADLEAKGGDITPQEKRLLEGLKIRLKNSESTQAEHEAKMERITSDKGFAAMMRDQQQLMNDYVQGKTQDEVIQAVKGMEETAEALKKDIGRTAEELKALAEDEKVRQIRARMDSRTLNEAATRIRKNYNSTINKQELTNELAKIRLMIANNADADAITAEIEGLAGRILDNRKSSVRNSSLDMLRGVTIRLGDSALREIYGTDSSLSEIRRQLAGSGIRLEQAKDGGSLDTKWDELLSFAPALDHYNGIETDTAENQAKAVAEFVKNAVEEQRRAGRAELEGEMENIIFDLTDELARINDNIPNDPKAKAVIREMSEYVREIAEKANVAGNRVKELEGQLAQMMAGGRKAANWSRAMKADVMQTIDYFNKTAKLAVDEAKRNKQDAIIQQLKDENNQKMMKANDEWRALIQRDADARRQAEKNALSRKKMGTVVNRIYKLLSAETDQQNIPEKYKGLARELVGMFVEHDSGRGSRSITRASDATLENATRLLKIWEQQDGPFDLGEFSYEGTDDEKAIAMVVMDDLSVIRDAMAEWNGKYNGKNKLDTLQKMGETLKRMQEAVSEIYNIIQTARTMDINGRKFQVEEMALRFLDGVKNSRFKGEATKKFGKALENLRKMAITGNITPEYFFRQLKNAGLDEIWNEFKRGENRNGLEIEKAKNRISEIAEKHGYSSWDLKKKYQVKTKNGTVDMTLEQLMALVATWKREQVETPEASQHLTHGGFYVEEEKKGKGLTGKQKVNARPHIMSADLMAEAAQMLTKEQLNYVYDMVAYMSNELSELGNEASMRMYGIKKYKEKFYYPFKRWSGVGNFSSDRGSTATQDDNRAAHKGWTKRRINNAKNALEIGNFTKTVVGHAVEMINYNTMAPAIEAMNKMLNWQMSEFIEGDEGRYIKRNMRAVFEQEYGKEALQYLETLLKDLNGGVAQDPRGSVFDKLLSGFKKNAVSGSLSVAAQQPLSYIRALMEIKGRYLMKGLDPRTFKGSYEEMMKHSGVAVIKQMGRFDMGYGASAKEYVTPQAAQTKGERFREGLSKVATGLPEIMDRATWTRMWEAVKAEQHAQHPEMDIKSDEFLDMVGERFNEVMRLTQVYDSVLVKSSNMRSKNPLMKTVTSFMAEPTLSLNVLRDAALNAKEKGGARKAAMAGATFLLSAIAQAAVKGFFGAGRNPDEDKTKAENWMYRFMYNLISEVNPASLVPGYSDLVELLTKGEINNDTMTPIGKMYDIIKTVADTASGKKELGYRLFEDTAGQIAQLFTGVPAKNIMRDARAMANWFAPDSTLNQLMGGKAYAKRETSTAVMKYQTIDTIMKQDLIGMVNTWLGDAGYKTSTEAYKQRIYEAKKAGDTRAAEEMTEYLTAGKGVDEKDIDSAVKKLAKEDERSSAAETAQFMADEGMDPNSYILEQVKKGNMSAEEAEKQMLAANPDADKKEKNEIFWKIDRAKYTQETGKDASGMYYRFKDAIVEKDMDTFYEQAELILEHGGNTDEEGERVTDAFRDGKIDRDTATEMMRYVYNKDEKSDDDIWWTLDRIEYQQETGAEKVTGNYYRLYDAMDKNSADEIGKAVNTMVQHGMKKENIKKQISSKYKQAYLDADNNGKRKIRDAMQKAYKKLGYKAEDADKTIKNWTK